MESPPPYAALDEGDIRKPFGPPSSSLLHAAQEQTQPRETHVIQPPTAVVVNLQPETGQPMSPRGSVHIEGRGSPPPSSPPLVAALLAEQAKIKEHEKQLKDHGFATVSDIGTSANTIRQLHELVMQFLHSKAEILKLRKLETPPEIRKRQLEIIAKVSKKVLDRDDADELLAQLDAVFNTNLTKDAIQGLWSTMGPRIIDAIKQLVEEYEMSLPAAAAAAARVADVSKMNDGKKLSTFEWEQLLLGHVQRARSGLHSPLGAAGRSAASALENVPSSEECEDGASAISGFIDAMGEETLAGDSGAYRGLQEILRYQKMAHEQLSVIEDLEDNIARTEEADNHHAKIQEQEDAKGAVRLLEDTVTEQVLTHVRPNSGAGAYTLPYQEQEDCGTDPAAAAVGANRSKMHFELIANELRVPFTRQIVKRTVGHLKRVWEWWLGMGKR